MESIIIKAALLLSMALSASAGFLELPIATTEAGVLSFWPSLNASCEMKTLQENLCCLDSTFKDASEAQNLLLQLLQSVPDPLYEVQRVSPLLYEVRNGMQVGTRYTCDLPLGTSELPGLGCHRCLQEIVKQIASGMPQNNGRCKNAWALRWGYIYEPETPWEEDTTWCHLDYWFRVVPSPIQGSWQSYTLSNLFRRMLTIASTWRWRPIPQIVW